MSIGVMSRSRVVFIKIITKVNVEKSFLQATGNDVKWPRKTGNPLHFLFFLPIINFFLVISMARQTRCT